MRAKAMVSSKTRGDLPLGSLFGALTTVALLLFPYQYCMDGPGRGLPFAAYSPSCDCWPGSIALDESKFPMVIDPLAFVADLLIWTCLVIILKRIGTKMWLRFRPEQKTTTGDWRITNQGQYLTGVALHKRPFCIRNGRDKWDHEHCEFCWAKIVPVERVSEHPDFICEAYATIEGNRWVCPKCYEDFKEQFQWKEPSSAP